ncbi:MAG: hypothetical protein V4684_06805 [Pseudomonadota bacterium]
MNANTPPTKAASATPAAPAEPRSGAGADTAFEAMLRKRQVHPNDATDLPAHERLPGESSQ